MTASPQGRIPRPYKTVKPFYQELVSELQGLHSAKSIKRHHPLSADFVVLSTKTVPDLPFWSFAKNITSPVTAFKTEKGAPKNQSANHGFSIEWQSVPAFQIRRPSTTTGVQIPDFGYSNRELEIAYLTAFWL
nr:hypothetical protein [uncultured Oscillibacter sp.]